MSHMQDFIKLIVPGAQEVQRQRGMFASVTIAQAIWETGGGYHTPHDKDTGAESYNLFGRKSKKGEPFVNALTWEVYKTLPKSGIVKYEKRSDGKYKVWVYAPFKKFNNFSESVLDRCEFLKSRYYVKACKSTNYVDAAKFLIDTDVVGADGKDIGYATDPAYVDGLLGVIKAYNLTQYDLPKGEEPEMTKQEADPIIALLGELWGLKKGDEKKQEEIHKRANVLREKSGQKPQ